MHSTTLATFVTLLATVHTALARVNCYSSGLDFKGSGDSLRSTSRQICQDNLSYFPTSESSALARYNFDSSSKINFLVRYAGPNSD